MSASALNQLADLHRAMYERALADAHDSLGSDSKVISRYAADFANSLPEEFKTVPARQISQALDAHRIVLFGDFHSHKQCQRALLRVIRIYNNTPDHAPMCLVLEMFRTKDQKHLDAWQEGRISDDELLDKTDYDTIWGFPWANYRPLLEFCKSHGIPLFAGNTRSAGKDNLKTRDTHAAGLLNKLADDHPSWKIFYLVGEYHLADTQLPRVLRESKSVRHRLMRIVVNADKYYFMMPPDRVHRRDNFLELNASLYCILNSPPWIKWQSQALHEEMKKIGASTYIESEIIGADDDDDNEDFSFEDEEEQYTEDSIDLDHYIKTTTDSLCHFLKIKNKSNIHDTFKINANVEDDDIAHLPIYARAAILEQSSRHGVAAEFNRRIIFLSELSINNLAFASGQIIFGSLSDLNENYESAEEQFIAQILKQAFGHITTKILNPRVSLHTKRAIEDYLGALRGKHVAGQTRLRRDVARATLKFFDWADNARSDRTKAFHLRAVPIDILNTDIRSIHEVARNIAQTIASSACQKLLAGRLDANDLGKWFSHNCSNTEKAKHLLEQMLRLVS